MISAELMQTPPAERFVPAAEKVRRAVKSKASGVFTDIYEEENNLVIWQRDLSATLQELVKDFLRENPSFKASMTVSPQSALASVSKSLGIESQSELSEDIAELVDMFCCLFDLNRAGLRLTALDRAICPKFHVDQVPCRLVTTYQGIATEWLPHEVINRTKLGLGSNGLLDHESGLYQNQQDIQQLNSGEVALLKGERWEGNEKVWYIVLLRPLLEKVACC